MEGQINKNMENKPLTSPISITPVNPEIMKLGARSPEKKIYIVLYNRTDEDSNGFLYCVGRYDCYTSIERLLNTYPIDIHESLVLVEVPAVNSKGSGEWMLKHPDNASSIYQFCKAVEGLFSNQDFCIDDFNDQNLEEEDNEPRPITEADLRASRAIPKDEVSEAYLNFLKDKSES